MVSARLYADCGAIDGFSLDMVGQNGIGAVYAGPDDAAKTWAEMDRFSSTGGQALFWIMGAVAVLITLAYLYVRPLHNTRHCRYPPPGGTA
ncbi:MAG: hypothetical protein ACNA7Q_09625, partial [Rhodobacterales bacterium]